MIAIQTEFRPEIPNVYGAADYREFRETLAHMDTVLRAGSAEALVTSWLDKWESERDGVVSPSRLSFMWRYAHYALRCNVARHLMGLSFRDFSIRLADSEQVLLRILDAVLDHPLDKGGVQIPCDH